VQLKEELDNISVHWPATTPPDLKHLHIIVELPSGERCVHWVSFKLKLCQHQSLASDLPWLEEIHSELWNREDRRPQLF
jgi:hypothetical protein